MPVPAAFLKSVMEALALEGYQPLPLSLGALALFSKPADGIYLTLGLIGSRASKCEFTGAFYYAPSFTWSYAPPDGFTERCYSRIGEWLTAPQRRKVEPDAGTRQVDVWWKGFTEENAAAFKAMAMIAEGKIRRTRGLADKARKCPAMTELDEQILRVRERFGKATGKTSKALEKVKRHPKVPEAWYAAAAGAALEEFPDFNHKDGISFLAEEAFLRDRFS